MSHDDTNEVEEGSGMTEGPKQYQKVKHTPLTEEDGWTVLSAAAIASGAIATAALMAEVATDGWLANTIGLGVYLTTPLGVGAAFLTGLVLRDRPFSKAIVPLLFAVAYWAIYVVSLLVR